MQLIASKTYFFYGNRNSPWWKWKGEQKYEDPRSSAKRFTFADVTDLRTGLSKKKSPVSFGSLNDRFIEIMIQGDEMILSPASKPCKL